MRAYISQAVPARPERDEMTLSEADELCFALDMLFTDALRLAHDYGWAKGYQAASSAPRLKA